MNIVPLKEAIMTTGDNYNITCPYCGRTNHYPVDTLVKDDGRGNYDFQKPCFHCKKVIRYQGIKARDGDGFPCINLTASEVS